MSLVKVLHFFFSASLSAKRNLTPLPSYGDGWEMLVVGEENLSWVREHQDSWKTVVVLKLLLNVSVVWGGCDTGKHIFLYDQWPKGLQ